MIYNLQVVLYDGRRNWLRSENEGNIRLTILLRRAGCGVSVNEKAVLVAEDDLVLQVVYRRQLEKLGYRVRIVSNGQEALEACRDSMFSLAILDLEMPVMDGIEATKKIREMEECNGKQRMPIVAITAQPHRKPDCMQAGMDDYFVKPCGINDLLRVLKRWAGEGD